MSKDAEFYYLLPRREMLPFVPKDVKRLLDVGCGVGEFGKLVKTERDAHVTGIELFSDAANQARTKIDVVLEGDVNKHLAGLPDASFDCIAFNDVLEHLVDPDSILLAVKRLLTPEGRNIASIPNIRFYRALKHILLEGDFKYVDWGIFGSTHMRFFTAKSIRRMFTEAGYEVEILRGINKGQPQKGISAFGVRVLWRLFPRSLDDTKYLQFACVVRHKPQIQSRVEAPSDRASMSKY